MAEPEYLYLQRVENLGVCPKCGALPRKPCTSSTYVGKGIYKVTKMSWPHSARSVIGFRR